MSSGITEKLARELYTDNITAIVQKVLIQELPNSLQITQNYYDALALNVLKTGYAIYCLLYTSPSPRDRQKSRMPSSA